ncbi:MAG: ABC transporter ATP-binding protein [Lachnospiraceae bacterium]|nr:ABC transporter ATP-binding protein [Lachnospiraceae bacterium]MDE6251660.1 ABC transporter ATP-binding protein [Lachnospiraceae bacterium]
MIEIKEAVKIYSADGVECHALNNVDLDIKQGEMVAVMGPSGSGKSTLLNIIGGMDKLTKGTYIYNDINVSEMSNTRLHRFRKDNISFIFQHFAMMNHYTVYENVEIPLIAKHIPKKKRKEIIMEKLELMKISEQAKKYPVQLSGGQQQRCAIARALASDNDLILADEPTGALDKATGTEIMKVLKEVNEMGKTIIIVTHDNNVSRFCERIICIEDGKIQE